MRNTNGCCINKGFQIWYQAVRTSASRIPACVIFDNLCKHFCASRSNFLPQCVEGTSKVLIIRCSHGLFFFFGGGGGGGGGGRDIERNQWPGSSDIDGQDQCEHMLNLVTVIAIFWVQRETIFDSNCSWHQQYVVENHKKYKTMSFQTDRASAHSAREPCIWPMMPPKVINDATEGNLWT